jgi:hypothetical protein
MPFRFEVNCGQASKDVKYLCRQNQCLLFLTETEAIFSLRQSRDASASTVRPIISLQDGQFIVPEPAVGCLQTKGLAHEIHEWLSGDHVTQTLRTVRPRPTDY